MSEVTRKTVRLGTILNGQYGPFMVLGSGKNSKPEYAFTVELRIKDKDGNVVYQGKNPLVNMYKPERENPKVAHELVVKLEQD